ncbi:valine--tRNA ligase [Sabethes cyaneus]|uniref:valine--tRNA ligase n=1 Tax=Sabethes cyaneus TaxID=53552 RepID=UPI00237E51EB|nr:valine--tRNA ligase [Sabethes cyaneus]
MKLYNYNSSCVLLQRSVSSTIRCYTRRALETAYKPALVEVNNRNVGNRFRKDKLQQGNENRFSLLLPPPNITGDLHLGHALTCAIQDVLIRWKEKQGLSCLWLPGMDHAGIATQVVVEKNLQKQTKLSRHDMGKEKFLSEVWNWKKEKATNIRRDLNNLGSRLNWEHEYFTMDKRQSKAVKEAFVQLFDANLIYRDKALVNWSCALESAISDIEVDNIEINGPTAIQVPGYQEKIIFGEMVDVAYKVSGTQEEILVSTTRPETLLGDVAVAVNPADARYDQFKGRTTMLWHPVRLCEIPLIFDESVDPEFGTGAVKITPAHDRYDYDVALKHQLPVVNVITSKGIIEKEFGPFSDLPRYKARSKMLDFLANQSLLRGTRPHCMVLPVCSRSKDVIEFLLRPQWFVRCQNMARKASQAVETGELRITPKVFEKEWFRWLENCHDWCISRQLWWGHQIPAYKVQSGQNSSWIAARSLQEAQSKAETMYDSKDCKVTQDSDVLDTWFSSSLLPFSSVGWPDNTTELQNFYPLNLMETGHDILFFWVARMVMLGQQLTGQLPFNNILLHGIICDEFGRKMSKSLGNVIKPEHVIKGVTLEQLNKEAETSHQQGILSAEEFKKSVTGQRKMLPNGIPECGTDALRFTMCSANVKNHFINFNVQECYTNKLFFNKIWQATRYSLNCTERFAPLDNYHLSKDKLTEIDRWILSRLSTTIAVTQRAFDDFNFHLATASWKTFFYNNFCDVYLETTKVHMSSEQASIAANHCLVLQHCLVVGLHHLEVFTPFLADELLTHLPAFQDLQFNPNEWTDQELESKIAQLLGICQSIRQTKSEFNPPIARKHNPVLHLLSKTGSLSNLIQSHIKNIEQLTQCSAVMLHTNEDTFSKVSFTTQSSASHECYFGIETDLRASKQVSSKSKKILKLESELDKLLGIVANEGYQRSANELVKRTHLEKIDQLKLQIKEMRHL